MVRYTLQERIEMIKIHYKNGDNLAETVRKTRTFLGRREATCRKAYKVQLSQELKPADQQQRRVSADWVVEMYEYDPEFHRKIILSDEAHFHLGGFVNKQNCRIWGWENPT